MNMTKCEIFSDIAVQEEKWNRNNAKDEDEPAQDSRPLRIDIFRVTRSSWTDYGI